MDLAATETPDLFNFDNTYARLPERFFARVKPSPVAQPSLIRLNDGLAQALGVDTRALSGAAAVDVFAGNKLAMGSEPIATAYAGHQFGGFVPKLGDGRAILLGEVVDPSGKRWDIQLKGSGPTPFSRSGDGRAALGPVLREFIVSEAFHALGIPTTRALAAVTTGENVWRQQPLPGAILTRVASSHIRVGTFQYFAVRKDIDGLRILADYVIARHYPDALESEQPYRAFLDLVIARQAQLVAQWLSIGFIHGVMNTDNTSIAGETIDYGPCAFMDSYHPAKVFSSIDHTGRYAYANQPWIAQWNLARLTETLLPLISEDMETAKALANGAIERFSDHFRSAYLIAFRRKLGLALEEDGDPQLISDLLDWMAATGADFTITFRSLNALAAETGTQEAQTSPAMEEASFAAWYGRWRQRLESETISARERQDMMRRANPAVIARNHRVEEVISAAVEHGDLQPFERLMTVLSKPFDDQPQSAAYANPPKPNEIVQQTFCGT